MITVREKSLLLKTNSDGYLLLVDGASRIILDDAITEEKDTSNYMYIEQVTFRAPYSLTLVGGDDQRLSVYLKQRGLPSI